MPHPAALGQVQASVQASKPAEEVWHVRLSFLRSADLADCQPSVRLLG